RATHPIIVHGENAPCQRCRAPVQWQTGNRLRPAAAGQPRREQPKFMRWRVQPALMRAGPGDGSCGDPVMRKLRWLVGGRYRRRAAGLGLAAAALTSSASAQTCVLADTLASRLRPPDAAVVEQ